MMSCPTLICGPSFKKLEWSVGHAPLWSRRSGLSHGRPAKTVIMPTYSLYSSSRNTTHSLYSVHHHQLHSSTFNNKHRFSYYLCVRGPKALEEWPLKRANNAPSRRTTMKNRYCLKRRSGGSVVLSSCYYY